MILGLENILEHNLRGAYFELYPGAAMTDDGHVK